MSPSFSIWASPELIARMDSALTHKHTLPSDVTSRSSLVREAVLEYLAGRELARQSLDIERQTLQELDRSLIYMRRATAALRRQAAAKDSEHPGQQSLPGEKPQKG